jgi:hypothetical protein
MPFQPSPRPASMLASVLAAAGVMLAVTGCSGITPLGPDTPPRPTRAAGSPVTVVGAVQLLLASPFVLEAVSVQAPTPAAGCPAGSVALPGGPGRCYLELGTPVTITAAGVSSLTSFRLTRRYGFFIAIPAAEQPALKAITTTATNAHGYLTISIAGRTWLLPSVRQPFTSPLQVALPSRNQTLQLHHLLVPSS